MDLGEHSEEKYVISNCSMTLKYQNLGLSRIVYNLQQMTRCYYDDKMMHPTHRKNPVYQQFSVEF